MKLIILLISLIITNIYADVCYAQGDPHMRTFSGKNWDFQKEGDFLLLQNKDVKIQSRHRHWGQTAFVITGLAVKFTDSETFVLSDDKGLEAVIGGKAVPLKNQNGLIHEFGKVKVIRKSNVISLVHNNMEIKIAVNTAGGKYKNIKNSTKMASTTLLQRRNRSSK
jgi:hypothetical protein